MFNVTLSVVINMNQLNESIEANKNFDISELEIESGDIDVLNLNIGELEVISYSIGDEVYEFTKVPLFKKKVKDYESCGEIYITETPIEFINLLKTSSLSYFVDSKFLIDEQKKYQLFIESLLEAEIAINEMTNDDYTEETETEEDEFLEVA